MDVYGFYHPKGAERLRSEETQAQILQMTQFILNEARDKAEEIDTKALQEESIERLKIVTSMKEKIQQERERIEVLYPLDVRIYICYSSYFYDMYIYIYVCV